MTLPELYCPQCLQRLLPPPSIPARRAASYDDCLRKCLECGIGFSNARSNPVRIYADPKHNIPQEVRGGLIEALENSLNERNRQNKKSKFGFETSEDAVTWTVFNFLQTSGGMVDLMNRLKLFQEPVKKLEELLLWGVSVGKNSSTHGREQLIQVSNSLGEAIQSRSEPDVILDFGIGGVAFIEVKYRSGNEIRTDNGCFAKYVDGTASFSVPLRVRRSGCYELARNWRIGSDFAGDRPFTLVNLAPGDLFINKKNRSAVDEFTAGLASSDKRRFIELSWEQMVASLSNHDPWLTEYLSNRNLVNNKDSK